MAGETDAMWEGFERRLARIEQLVTQLLDRLSSTQANVSSVERTVTAVQKDLVDLRARIPRECEDHRRKVIEDIHGQMVSLEKRILREVEDVEENLSVTKDGLNGKMEREVGKTVGYKVSGIESRMNNLADAFGNLVTRIKYLEENPRIPVKEEKKIEVVSLLSLLVSVGVAVAAIIFGILNSTG
jgi:chromosome segregation ATPase